MRGLFTRDERAVVLFLAGALLVGSLVLALRTEEAPPPDETIPERALESPIDLNAAEPELLEELPGVGPVRAREIVRHRRERGGFRSVDELVEVRGIGPVTLERMRPHVVVGGSAPSDSGGDRQ